MRRFRSQAYAVLDAPVPIDPLILQNFLVIIPAFNESKHVKDLVGKLRAMSLNVLVVDDGSTDGTGDVAKEAGATVIRLETNQGKGAALASGFVHAEKEGYDAVVTMDADGQHDPADVLRFFDTYNRTGIPVLVGNRTMDRKRMPWLRRVTNFQMSRVINRHMRQYIADTQNGMRLYQTDVISMVKSESKGFAAESEILLKIDEIGIRMGSVPVAAIYGNEKSHIRPLHDTHLFFAMLRRYLRKSKIRA
ncbi:MAG: glycosyltransferase family 2 protein [Verrucomicrobia bacterium]|nr:glycosyltransferase family 2 protein [Verrucomicrobiota bacterium]MCH8510381.1 glycosyltransferase family 2 protein [Kiritimatiellia bacterium]